MRMTLLTRLERACDNGMVGGVWPKIDSHCDKEEKEEKEEEGGICLFIRELPSKRRSA